MRRAGFGGTKAEIDALMTRPNWLAVVDKVLDTTANPPDPIPAAVLSNTDAYYGAWVASTHHWMDRMATSPTPIVEKMTLFWHGHLTSSVVEVELPRMMHRQIRTWRANALGDVHTLFQAMAVDPAMLRYLNGDTNTVNKPNENFGREILELFALGNGNFTETDVTAMARAWTGYGLADDRETYLYRPALHDTGLKTLFGITKNWDGPGAITELVKGVKAPDCARHIARRVWAFFAYPDPSPALVNDLAAVLLYTGGSIKYLLRGVFLRPEFRLPSTRTALVRSPVEWIVAGMRATGLPSSTVHPEWYMERMGQRLYGPPNVSGWRPNEGWISSTSQWAKGNLATRFGGAANTAGVLAPIAKMTPAAAVSFALATFGIDVPSIQTRQRLEQYVAAERTARREWALPWTLVTLIMLTPDFQLS